MRDVAHACNADRWYNVDRWNNVDRWYSANRLFKTDHVCDVAHECDADYEDRAVPNDKPMVRPDPHSDMIPERYARYYLENAPSLLWLIGVNVLALLVGVHFYVETMPGVHLFLWPLYLDSPVALFLMTLSLVTLLPHLGRPLSEARQNLALAYLHTLAFVWLVKYGLWTVLALNLGFSAYFPALWAYFGIIVTHLAFVLQAYLLPHYGRTTKGALALALVLMLLNDLFDYGLGYHPPLEYEPGLALPVLTVGLSFVAVGLASRAFDRLDPDAASNR